MNIDKNRLHYQFDTLAKSTLKVVSASSLKLFALEVENAAKSAILKAIEQEYDEVSKKLEGERLSKFLDLSNGYLVTMNTWVNSNTIRFPRIPVMEEPDERGANSNATLRDIVKRKEVQTFGIGTALSIILFFSGMKFIALVTEALATATSIYMYKQDNRQSQVINEQAKVKFEQEVSSYISSVIEAALNWVSNAENKSESLISSFK